MTATSDGAEPSARPACTSWSATPRFLIAPPVHVPHLASHLLGTITARLRDDWQARYGNMSLPVETFVEVGRHRGTCYQAANWVRVGATKGRGKLDRYNAYALPVKDIYLYPLVRSFRRQLSEHLTEDAAAGSASCNSWCQRRPSGTWFNECARLGCDDPVLGWHHQGCRRPHCC